jgi:pimeloyl-ACP methyl ester carboxylesterase
MLNFVLKPGIGQGKIIFLHGVLGTHKSLAVLGMKKFDNYFLDMRNHGNSFWKDSSNISEQAKDVANFITENNL